jgi:lipopolysaccharide/colanic/teichoic acid biosynthesis glycosyltransferase
MRQKSLDELPQLINVLIGEMSLVGPRPHVAGQLAAGVPCESVIPYYAMRHLAKPGITGWAQVNGYRGPTDTIGKARRRVDHDLAYIRLT